MLSSLAFNFRVEENISHGINHNGRVGMMGPIQTLRRFDLLQLGAMKISSGRVMIGNKQPLPDKVSVRACREDTCHC